LESRLEAVLTLGRLKTGLRARAEPPGIPTRWVTTKTARRNLRAELLILRGEARRGTVKPQ